VKKLCIFCVVIFALICLCTGLSLSKWRTTPSSHKSPSTAKLCAKNSTSTQTDIAYDPACVKNYITEQAKAANVNVKRSQWIVKHESQYGQLLIGDGGRSLGPWQISMIYHPEVSPSCAMDLKCSTHFSLGLLRKGEYDQWSSWKYRRQFFPHEQSPA
jgi:hypothetical protein